MATLASIRALLRRLRAERGQLTMLFVLLLVTSSVLAAGPLLFNRAVDAGLQHALASAGAAERNVELIEFGGGTGLGHEGPVGHEAVERRGEELETRLPATVRGLIEERTYLLDSVRFLVGDAPRPPSHLTLRFQSGVDEHLRFVEGRPPAEETADVEIPGAVGPDGSPLRGTAYEIALSTATADALGFALGDRIYLSPELSVSQGYAAADLVGLFEVADPTAEYWVDDQVLADPVIVLESVNVRRILAIALVSADSYDALLAAGLPIQHRWRYFLDTDRLDASGLEALERDLRRMSAEYTSFVPNLPRDDVTSLRTGLVNLIEGYADRRVASEAVLALAAVGVAAIAGLALTLVSALVAQGRRRSLALARWRGASMAQLLGAELVAALALAVPAAVLGWALATLAVPGRPSTGSPLAAAAVAGTAVLVQLVATALSILAARRAPERPDEGVLRIRPRRLVAEGLVVALAIAGAVLLRNRGLLAEGATGGAPGVDPLLAATPVLLGAAAGLVTVRVYPLPLRLLGRLAALRRDLVPLHALQRSARASSSSHAPLLVLLLAVAIGAFSSVMLVTIQRGQSETAWREVGADFRVDPGPADSLPSGLDPASVEGVAAVAGAYDDEDARLVGRAFGGERILVRAVDGDAYRDVVAGTPADPPLPAALLTAAPDEAGSEEAPLPAIVSRGFEVRAGEQAGIGDRVEISVAGNHLSVEAVAVRASFPGIDGGSFVIVSYDWLRAAIPDHELLPTVLFVRGEDAAEAGLRSLVDEALPPGELVSRPGRYAELRESPLVRAVDVGFGLALVATTAYTLLGVAAALALRAGARARDLARLSTLGLSRRQLTGLTLIEYGPPLVVALAAGTALGLAIAWLLLPSLGLDALLGATTSGAPAIDPPVVAGVILLEAAVAAAGMLAAAWAVRRLALARAVRGDDE